jgi:hypothetical protein
MYRTQGRDGYWSCDKVSFVVFAKLKPFMPTHLWLNNLEISHLNARSREVRNLKLDADGTLRFAASANTAHAATETTHHSAALLIVTAHTGQTELGAHKEFLATTELLDLPYDGAGFRRVVH